MHKHEYTFPSDNQGLITCFEKVAHMWIEFTLLVRFTYAKTSKIKNSFISRPGTPYRYLYNFLSNLIFQITYEHNLSF